MLNCAKVVRTGKWPADLDSVVQYIHQFIHFLLFYVLYVRTVRQPNFCEVLGVLPISRVVLEVVKRDLTSLLGLGVRRLYDVRTVEPTKLADAQIKNLKSCACLSINKKVS